MGINVYERDDVVRIRSTFLSYAKEYTDPTTVTLSVRDPAGSTTVYYYASGDITKEATGVYYYNLALNATGRWVYRWAGTGPVAGATEDAYMDVRGTVF